MGECITLGVGWNMTLFEPFIPPTMAHVDFLTREPDNSRGPDLPVWAFTTDGSFSTKTAYDLLTGGDKRNTSEAIF